MVAAVTLGAMALMGLGLWLRLLPERRAQVGGVDAWFYLLYADAVRRQRRLPVHLRHFLLDIEEQWYPPFLPLLLAALPERVRLRARGWISPAIDVLQLAILEATAVVVGMDAVSVLLAGLVYAITPTLVFESSTLNSRSLGSLIFTLWMLSLFGVLAHDGRAWILLSSAVAALLLLTHKLATQLWALVVLALAVATGRGEVLAVGCAAPVLAWAVSGGFYLKVLRGHLAILQFWRKHLGNLNAHQVYDASPYADGRPSDQTTRSFYGRGLGGVWRLCLILVAHDPWMLLLPWLAWPPAPDTFGRFLLLWALIGCAAALLTTFVPAVRFLGEGYKYLKFIAFPLALMTGRALASWPEALLLVPPLLLSAAALRRFQRARAFEVMDDDFEKVLARLMADPRQAVATIPAHRSDPIAYLAGKQVLWGGHSAGYEKLGAWYPVIAKPIPDLLDAYGVPLLLVDCLYVDPERLRLDGEFRPVMRQGRFLLLERVPPASR